MSVKKYDYESLSTNEQLIYSLEKARECLQDGRINLAFKILQDVSLDLETNNNLLLELSQTLLASKQLELAITLLEKGNLQNIKVFSSLCILYVRLKQEHKLYKLYNNIEPKNFYPQDGKRYYNEVKNYLAKTHSDIVAFPHNYYEQMLANYRESAALNHIKERHAKDNGNFRKKNTSCFVANIDIEGTFYYLKKTIKAGSDQTICHEHFSDTYIYESLDCGLNHNYKKCDYLKVVTLPNTNKIVTMFPLDEGHVDSSSKVKLSIKRKGNYLHNR